MPIDGRWGEGYDAGVRDAAAFLIRQLDQPGMAENLLQFIHGRPEAERQLRIIKVEDPCPAHPHQGLAPTGLASGEKVCPEDGGHLVGGQEVAAGGKADLVAALRDVRAAFAPIRVRDGVGNLPVPFWLDMLQAQIDEAREHVGAGRQKKALAEIADCFSVGWQAISDNLPVPCDAEGAPCLPCRDTEAFIVHRIRTRIIPRAEELANRDLAKIRGIQEKPWHKEPGCICDPDHGMKPGCPVHGHPRTNQEVAK